MNRSPLPDFVSRETRVKPAPKESSGVIKMTHSIDGEEMQDRIFNMRLQADRESFVKFASWASRNSVTFTCTAL